MIKTEKKTINGREWQCTQWSGSKNLAMFHKISSLVLPTFAHGIVPGQNILSANVDLAGAVDTLLKNLGDSPAFTKLVQEILNNVHIDDRPLTKEEFDVAFVGPRLFDLAPGIMFVIETNFGDFSKLVAFIMRQFADQQKKAEAAQQAQISEGESTPA